MAIYLGVSDPPIAQSQEIDDIALDLRTRDRHDGGRLDIGQ